MILLTQQMRIFALSNEADLVHAGLEGCLVVADVLEAPILIQSLLRNPSLMAEQANPKYDIVH